MSKSIEITILVKQDHQLSKRDLHSVFHIYNQCFADSSISSTKKILLAKKLLGKSKVWTWYLALVKGQIIGMASYVPDLERAKSVPGLDLRPDCGENICSVSVLPKYRQLGIARLLMQQIIDDHGSQTDLVVEIKRTSPIYSILREFYHSLEFKEDDNQNEQHLFLRRKQS